jgi:hypothetical protein
VSEPEIPGITDGRKPGDFFSRYTCGAWVQILIELIFLVILLVGGLALLFFVGYGLAIADQSQSGKVAFYFDLPQHRTFLIWVSIAISGAIGGVTFSLKWLYHSVAKSLWNRDRVLWRFIVPIISGVLAMFCGFMIVSGIVPFLSRTAFDNFYVALGFGFFTGYFSDNVLAALQRLAKRTFGTVDEPPGEKKEH